MPKTNVLIQQKLDSILVKKSATILEAMKVIDQGAAQIILVVDDQKKLEGVMTDGDLRRAILSGANLNDPIEKYVFTRFRSVQEGTNRTEALDLMKCFSIEQLPILDEAGRVCGLHLLNELIQSHAFPNAAMILAGGKGSRLGNLTKSIPKPMIKVAGRPILERIVLHLVGGGIRNIFLSVNYLADVIQEHFGDGEAFGCKITYLQEDQPLGTGGPLALMGEHQVTEPMIVMNGDLIADFDVAGIIDAHLRDQNMITIGVRSYSHEVPFGCIQIEGHQVVKIAEKPTYHETINAGIYVLDASLIKLVPREYFPITKLVELVLKQKQRVGAFQIDEWIDIGQPDQLSKARGTGM